MIPMSIIVRVAMGLAHDGGTTAKRDDVSTFRFKPSGSVVDESVTFEVSPRPRIIKKKERGTGTDASMELL